MKGVKKASKINLETCRSLKVCSFKKKGKATAVSKPSHTDKATLKEKNHERWLEYKMLANGEVTLCAVDPLDLPSRKRMKGVITADMINIYLEVKKHTDKVPLKKEDHKIWLEFKKLLAKGKSVNYFDCCEIEEGKWPLELDHPFIPMIADFAIDAFNVVCQKLVKKGKNNNICHHQVMACKYITLNKHHCFFVSMEAIEEGILGVYKAIVGYDVSDGSRTLVRFNLTDTRPTGKIAMTLPHLIHLKSRYNTMKGMKRDLEINLEATQKSMEGKNKRKVAAEMNLLKEQHKAMKGTCKVLYRRIQAQIAKTWNQSTDPDTWLVHSCSYGLKERSVKATCMGYDYYSLSEDFKKIFGIIM